MKYILQFYDFALLNCPQDKLKSLEHSASMKKKENFKIRKNKQSKNKESSFVETEERRIKRKKEWFRKLDLLEKIIYWNNFQ